MSRFRARSINSFCSSTPLLISKPPTKRPMTIGAMEKYRHPRLAPKYVTHRERPITHIPHPYPLVPGLRATLKIRPPIARKIAKLLRLVRTVKAMLSAAVACFSDLETQPTLAGWLRPCPHHRSASRYRSAVLGGRHHPARSGLSSEARTTGPQRGPSEGLPSAHTSGTSPG